MATTGVVAALAAALCWAVSSSLWRRLPTSLSAAQLNLVKNLLAVGIQLPVLLLGGWLVSPLALVLLVASGVLGIALGDSLYFAALRRLGTRRTLTLEAGGPALSLLGGALFLAEWPRWPQGLGVALICLSVALVARQQPPPGTAGVVPLPQGGQPPWFAAVPAPCSRERPCVIRLCLRSSRPPCAWRRRPS